MDGADPPPPVSDMVSRRRIICLGTTPTLSRTMMFDRVEVGGINRASRVHDYASGKPVNVARVLRALGREAVLICPLGGERGRRIREDLGQCGIVDASIEVPAQTRLCVTLIDHHAGTATELIEEHAGISHEATQALLTRLAIQLAGAGAVVMTGSVAAGAGDDFYARAVRIATEAGVPAIVDGCGEALRLALSQRPAVVKLNRMEAAKTLREPADPATAARRLAQNGCRWAVVTDGAHGAWASDGGEALHIKARRVAPVSAIGSGDAFAAGMAIAMVESLNLEQACRLGTALGAANALTPDAGHLDTGQLDLSQLV